MIVTELPCAERVRDEVQSANLGQPIVVSVRLTQLACVQAKDAKAAEAMAQKAARAAAKAAQTDAAAQTSVVRGSGSSFSAAFSFSRRSRCR